MTIIMKISQLYPFCLIYQKNTYIIKKNWNSCHEYFSKSLMSNLKTSWMLAQSFKETSSRLLKNGSDIPHSEVNEEKLRTKTLKKKKLWSLLLWLIWLVMQVEGTTFVNRYCLKSIKMPEWRRLFTNTGGRLEAATTSLCWSILREELKILGTTKLWVHHPFVTCISMSWLPWLQKNSHQEEGSSKGPASFR